MKNTFTGKLVRLRAFEPEDLALFEAEDKNRDTEKDRCDYMIQLPRAAWKLREDFPSRLRREGEMETFRFMIEDLEGNTVGSINAHDVDARMGTFSYGLGIYEPYRRRGYAREAILLLLRFYFLQRGVHRAAPEPGLCGGGAPAGGCLHKGALLRRRVLRHDARRVPRKIQRICSGGVKHP